MGCESSKNALPLCGRNVGQVLRPTSAPWVRNRGGGATLFPGPYGQADTAIPHILLLGPQGGGKSTLLYATLLPGWQGTAALTPTRPLHYEELSRGNIKIGVWDVSGSDAMRSLWPTLYQLISVSVVVFVISVQSSEAIVEEARVMIRRLLNEASLGGSAFVLVLNTCGLDENSDGCRATISQLEQQLGVISLRESNGRAQRKRPLASVVVDAHHAAEDSRWRRTLDWMFSSCLPDGIDTTQVCPSEVPPNDINTEPTFQISSLGKTDANISVPSHRSEAFSKRTGTGGRLEK